MSEDQISTRHLQQRIAKGEFEEVLYDIDKHLASSAVLSQEQIELLYIKAVCLRLLKRHSLAIDTLENLHQLAPKHARKYQEQAYNYKAMGKDKEAANAFYFATKYNPALLSAWQALLPIYQNAGQDKAISLCKNQIKQLMALPKPILAATDLMHEGKLAEADEACRRYLRQNKHSLPALLLLSELAIKLKAIAEAEFILETCCELAPNELEAKYELFKVYSKLGKFSKALAIARELNKKDPENLFYGVAIATAMQGVGEIDEAIKTLHSIIDKHGEQAHVFLLLGHAFKTQGQIDKSIAAYQKAYALNKQLGDAYWSLANTKTYQFSEKEIAAMQSCANSQDVDEKDRIHFHFALGKAHEDAKEFDISFEHYAQGNNLQRQLLPFSIQKHKAFIEHQIRSYSPEFVSKLQNIGYQDPAPIFIVGMPRAGSTLIEQILSSHSKVDGTMELHEILDLAAKLSKKRANSPGYPLNISELSNDTINALGKKFIEDTKVYRAKAPYFIDKMPNNFMHIGLIKTILPKAKIIDARREPMACCFSGYKQLFGDGQEFSYGLTDIGLYYQNYTKLMEHWDSVYPDEILLVQHEQLIENTESEVKRILDYCDLEFELACLEFYKSKRAVKTPSAQQVRQPIFKSSMEQWKNYESQLKPLIELFR